MPESFTGPEGRATWPRPNFLAFLIKIFWLGGRQEGEVEHGVGELAGLALYASSVKGSTGGPQIASRLTSSKELRLSESCVVELPTRGSCVVPRRHVAFAARDTEGVFLRARSICCRNGSR